MSLLVLALDADVAGHVAVAIRRHRSALAKNGLAEPPALADLEAAALEIVSKRQEASPGVTVTGDMQDGERDYLTRIDVHRLTGASLSTVDRWIASGQLPSTRRGRVRRVSRVDLDRFLGAAA